MSAGGRPVVPHVQSYYFTWDADTEMLMFPADKHRTYLAIEDDDTHDLLMWVGNNPPADLSQWWSIAQTHVFFEYGVYGPIYLAEPITGQGDGDAKILSNLAEEPTAEALPT